MWSEAGTFGRVQSGYDPEPCEEMAEGKGEGRELDHLQQLGGQKRVDYRTGNKIFRLHREE